MKRNRTRERERGWFHVSVTSLRRRPSHKQRAMRSNDKDQALPDVHRASLLTNHRQFACSDHRAACCSAASIRREWIQWTSMNLLKLSTQKNDTICAKFVRKLPFAWWKLLTFNFLERWFHRNAHFPRSQWIFARYFSLLSIVVCVCVMR